MARRKRIRATKTVLGLGSGLGGAWYPDQPCGLTYEKFRSGFKYRDAYEALAYRRNERDQSFRPSARRVVSKLAQMKREVYEKYREDCSVFARVLGRDYEREMERCERVCRQKVCGRSCQPITRNCRKPPAESFCLRSRFEPPSLTAEQLEAATAAAREERIAQVIADDRDWF